MNGIALKPVFLATLAAAIWGLWWVPVRWLEARGLDGAMGGIAMNGGALVGALTWVAARREALRLDRRALLGTALAGAAVGSYSLALVHGDVVRVVLLFYLAPAWSKFIEWRFLDLPWRWPSTVAIVAALSGAALVMGGGISAVAIGSGDVLALVSGMCWAAGAALIFSAPANPGASLIVGTAFGATLVGVLFALAEGVSLPPPGPVAQGMATGIVYVLPILALTLWSARRLPPALLSFLLTAEILMGVVSGVLFLDEPFSGVQAAGAVLIVLGALAELLPRLRPVPDGGRP